MKRFWRVNIASCSAGMYGALSEIQFADSVGGASLFGTGTAIAQSNQTGHGPALAVDGSLITYWGGAGPLPVWWGYDFGAGNAPTVVEVRITADAGLTSYHPSAFTLDGSDDASTWVTEASFTPSAWVGSVQQTFDVGGAGQIDLRISKQQTYAVLQQIDLRISKQQTYVVLQAGAPATHPFFRGFP